MEGSIFSPADEGIITFRPVASGCIMNGRGMADVAAAVVARRGVGAAVLCILLKEIRCWIEG